MEKMNFKMEKCPVKNVGYSQRLSSYLPILYLIAGQVCQFISVNVILLYMHGERSVSNLCRDVSDVKRK